MTVEVAKRRGAAIGFLLLLAIMIGLPVWNFSKPRPTRFGWQMYSGVRPVPQFWLVFPNNQPQEVPLREILAHPRNDQSEYEAAIAAELLRRHPDAVRVRVEWDEKTPTREFP